MLGIFGLKLIRANDAIIILFLCVFLIFFFLFNDLNQLIEKKVAVNVKIKGKSLSYEF